MNDLMTADESMGTLGKKRRFKVCRVARRIGRLIEKEVEFYRNVRLIICAQLPLK
jgi:hypothetical protein